MAFNWWFVQLNDAYSALNSIPHDKLAVKRTLFVCSDVVRSNLVGDTMTDLLSVAPYKGEARWWEPQKIEYHPLRSPSITIIEVILA